MSELTAADVRQMVEADVARWQQPHQAREVTDRLARRLGRLDLLSPRDIDQRRAASRFSRQVRSALEGMPTLIKLANGEPGPSGRTRRYAGIPVYYTQPLWDAEAAEHAARRAVIDAVAERWRAVNAALSERGLFGTGQPGERPKLSLAVWERLVAQLKGES